MRAWILILLLAACSGKVTLVFCGGPNEDPCPPDAGR
jgi:hypothetical protein